MSANVLRILDNLKTVLAGINGVAPYRVAVTTVAYWAEPVVKISRPELPWIGVRPIKAQVQNFPCNQQRKDLRIALHVIISASSSATAIEKLANLEDDIKYALNLDPCRGATGAIKNAVSTLIVDTSYEEYTPDNNLASMVITLSCPFHESLTAVS